MQSSKEEIPSNSISLLKRAQHLSRHVAIGAIFLLLLVFLRVQGSSDSESLFTASLVNTEGELSSISRVILESPELLLIQGDGIKPNVPPLTITPQVLGAIIGQTDVDIRPEVIRYATEPSDTIASVAEKFNISQNTLIWANDLSVNSTLIPDKELIILPVSGTLHLVRPNDTLSEIATWYKGDTEEIVAFNNLESKEAVFAGDLLIIPDGVMPKTLPSSRLTPIANSYFIYPVPAPHRITQGLHSFNAVDFSNGKCAEPIYAAAGGIVQKTGYTKLGGNYVRILHPNDVVTYYGHLSSILALPGTRVLQGQIVGYTGYTGYTIPAGPSGCHLHFEVRGAANPFR